MVSFDDKIPPFPTVNLTGFTAVFLQLAKMLLLLTKFSDTNVNDDPLSTNMFSFFLFFRFPMTKFLASSFISRFVL